MPEIIPQNSHLIGNIFYIYSFKKKWYSLFRLPVNRDLSWWESIAGGLNEYKLTLSKNSFLSHSLHLWRSFTLTFDPLIFLSLLKKNNFSLSFLFIYFFKQQVLNPQWMHLRCVHMTALVHVLTCLRANLPHRPQCWSQIFFSPLDLFSKCWRLSLEQTCNSSPTSRW